MTNNFRKLWTWTWLRRTEHQLDACVCGRERVPYSYQEILSDFIKQCNFRRDINSVEMNRVFKLLNSFMYTQCHKSPAKIQIDWNSNTLPSYGCCVCSNKVNNNAMAHNWHMCVVHCVSHLEFGFIFKLVHMWGNGRQLKFHSVEYVFHCACKVAVYSFICSLVAIPTQ